MVRDKSNAEVNVGQPRDGVVMGVTLRENIAPSGHVFQVCLRGNGRVLLGLRFGAAARKIVFMKYLERNSAAREDLMLRIVVAGNRNCRPTSLTVLGNG